MRMSFTILSNSYKEMGTERKKSEMSDKTKKGTFKPSGSIQQQMTNEQIIHEGMAALFGKCEMCVEWNKFLIFEFYIIIYFIIITYNFCQLWFMIHFLFALAANLVYTFHIIYFQFVLISYYYFNIYYYVLNLIIFICLCTKNYQLR